MLNRFGSITDPAAVRAATLEALDTGLWADFDIDQIVAVQIAYNSAHGYEMPASTFWAMVEDHTF